MPVSSSSCANISKTPACRPWTERGESPATLPQRSRPFGEAKATPFGAKRAALVRPGSGSSHLMPAVQQGWCGVERTLFRPVVHDTERRDKRPVCRITNSSSHPHVGALSLHPHGPRPVQRGEQRPVRWIPRHRDSHAGPVFPDPRPAGRRTLTGPHRSCPVQHHAQRPMCWIIRHRDPRHDRTLVRPPNRHRHERSRARRLPVPSTITSSDPFVGSFATAIAETAGACSLTQPDRREPIRAHTVPVPSKIANSGPGVTSLATGVEHTRPVPRFADPALSWPARSHSAPAAFRCTARGRFTGVARARTNRTSMNARSRPDTISVADAGHPRLLLDS